MLHTHALLAEDSHQWVYPLILLSLPQFVLLRVSTKLALVSDRYVSFLLLHSGNSIVNCFADLFSVRRGEILPVKT